MSGVKVAKTGFFDRLFAERPEEIAKREKIQDRINRQQESLRDKIDSKLKGTIGVYYFNNIYQVLRSLPPTEKSEKICIGAADLADNFADFYNTANLQLESEQWAQRLYALERSLVSFVELVQDNQAASTIKKPLQHVLSMILGIVLGTIGAVTGSIVGNLKGIYQLKSPFKLGYENMLAGAVIGCMTGKRLPELLFNNWNHEKIRLTTDNLQYLHKRLSKKVTQKSSKEHVFDDESEIQADVKKYIIRECCDKSASDEAKEEFFKKFLERNHAIQLCSIKAKFATENLDGDLGHHAFMRIAVDNKCLLPIEFGWPYNYPPTFVHQAEEIRVVTGRQLYSMLVTHKRMKEIQNFSFDYVVNQYSPSNNDCKSYVDALLEMHGLQPSNLDRFPAEGSSTLAKYVYNKCIAKTNFFSQDELNIRSVKFKVRHFSFEECQKEVDKKAKEALGSEAKARAEVLSKSKSPKTFNEADELRKYNDIKREARLAHTGFSDDVRKNAIESFNESQQSLIVVNESIQP